MSVPFRIDVDDPDLVVGVVEASGAAVRPGTAALDEEIRAAVARAAAGPWPPDDVRAAVRDLLRRGGYKPTGRGKPASEYLAQAAARGEFPRISGAVDALNLVSLESGIPISLLDVPRAIGGAAGLVLRRGTPGEAFVFNAGGQSIDVEGLLGVAREGGAQVGNPVKDSMEAKLRGDSTDLIAVLYGTRRVTSSSAMETLAARLASLLARESGATATSRAIG